MNVDSYVRRILQDSICYHDYIFPDIETKNAVYAALEEDWDTFVYETDNPLKIRAKNWNYNKARSIKDANEENIYTDRNDNKCVFYIETVSNYYTFKNWKTIINCTPHPIRFQELDNEVVTINSNPEYLINAQVSEEVVQEDDDIIFTRPTFLPTPEGAAIINRIGKEFYPGCVIIGSIIAAQAYPGQVCGMCPIPGHERVAPAEKLMRVDKFTRY